MAGYLSLRITKVIPETLTASTLVLAPPEAIFYHPGQFLTLVFEGLNGESRRSYSISSAPAWNEPLSITVKRKINGELSRFILDRLKPGDELRSLPPSGIFTLDPPSAPSRDYILFGAGIGISPLLPLIKTILISEPCRILLVYSNTNWDSVIFRSSIRALEKRFGERFRCMHILSNPASGGEAISGHLNNGLVERIVSDWTSSVPGRPRFLVCGPPAYMRMVILTLRYMGFEESDIRRENFVVPALPTQANISSSPHLVKIFSGKMEWLIEVAPGTSILQAALDQGLELPYSCKGGVCSTCKCLLKKGKVVMSVNEVLTDKELNQGWILTCTGYPMEEGVVLESGRR